MSNIRRPAVIRLSNLLGNRELGSSTVDDSLQPSGNLRLPNKVNPRNSTHFRFTCGQVNQNLLKKLRTNSHNFLNSAYYEELKSHPSLSIPLKILIIYYLSHGGCGKESRAVEGDISRNRIRFMKGSTSRTLLPLNLMEEMAQISPFYSYNQLSVLPGIIDLQNENRSNRSVLPQITIDQIIDQMMVKITANGRNGQQYGSQARANLPDFGTFDPKTGINALNEGLKANMVVSTLGYLYIQSVAFAKYVEQNRYNTMMIIYNYLITPIPNIRYQKIAFILSFVHAFPTTDTFYYSGAYTSFMDMIRNGDSSKITNRYLYALLMDYNKSQRTLGIPEEYLRGVIGFKKLSDVYQANHLNMPFTLVAETYNHQGRDSKNLNFESEIEARTREAYPNNRNMNNASYEPPANYRNNLINRNSQKIPPLLRKINNSGRQSQSYQTGVLDMLGSLNPSLRTLVEYYVGHSKIGTGIFAKAISQVRTAVRGESGREVLIYGWALDKIKYIQFRKGKEIITFDMKDMITICNITVFLSFHQLYHIHRLLKEYKEMMGYGNNRNIRNSRNNRNNRNNGKQSDIRNFIKSLVLFMVVLVPNSDLKARIKDARQAIYPFFDKRAIPQFDQVIAFHSASIQGCNGHEDNRNAILALYAKAMSKRASSAEMGEWVCNAQEMLNITALSNQERIRCQNLSEGRRCGIYPGNSL